MNYTSEKGSAIYWWPRKSPDRQLVPINVQSKTSISFDLVFFSDKKGFDFSIYHLSITVKLTIYHKRGIQKRKKLASGKSFPRKLG